MQRANLNDLLAFVAVGRERSFTKAAAKLGVSQCALSHTIRGLEERLGVRLLARTTRSVSPTDAGERLLHTVGPRLEEIEAEPQALSELREKPAGTIRITALDYAAETVFWPKFAKLLREYRRADQSGPVAIATSAIQRARRRPRRAAMTSPSKSVGTRSSVVGSTPSRQLTLTTA